jgi:hypothetical protein
MAGRLNVTEPVVLDSFALVSLFHKELGWRKVRDTHGSEAGWQGSAQT